ncbi:MAG: DUF63 family protein, partial [Candidatus Aenigmarchaeota archaeon]|nr:DUF63 family protein [Candidatus Aenigmarchaeota archaeon]
MDFLYEYFLKPILSNGWFNPVNSITYGIILVAGVYLVFKLLKKMNIHIDRYFLYAILPFILWGSSTRVLHDAAYYGVLTGKLGEFYALPIFPTPGSYMITFLLALIVLLISLTIQRYAKFPYWKVMLAIGIVLDIVNFALLPRIDLIPMFMVLGITGLWTALFFLLYKFSQTSKFKTLKDIFTFKNSGLLSAHMLDASATYVAMTFFGYLEQHPLPRFLIELTNPAAMFFLKIVVLIPVLYMIDRYS